MQLSSGTHIPDGLLAANALLSEKLHQGFAAPKSTLHQGFSVSISSTPLGIIRPLYDGDVGSRYTGKERDTESGLDFFPARYYGSNMGRFMSPDDGSDQGANNPQSWNLYSYGRNNPLIGTDPDGRNYYVTNGQGQGGNIDDRTFETEEQGDKQQGEYFQNGIIFHFDANGNQVNDGTFTYTGPDIAGDASSNLAAMGNVGNGGMAAIGYFAAGSVAVGTTGGVGLFALGTGAGLTTLGTFPYILSNAEAGAIIGWGTGQAESGVLATQQLAANLTAEDVAGMEAKGLNSATAQKLLNTYERAVAAGKAGEQAMARRELMIKIVQLMGK